MIDPFSKEVPEDVVRIARAILKMDGHRSDRDIDDMKASRSFLYKWAVDEATLSFNMTIRICMDNCPDNNSKEALRSLIVGEESET